MDVASIRMSLSWFPKIVFIIAIAAARINQIEKLQLQPVPV